MDFITNYTNIYTHIFLLKMVSYATEIETETEIEFANIIGIILLDILKYILIIFIV